LTVRGPSVLVADDDPAVRLLLRRELTAAGYRVQAVEPSQRALRSITERQFDLLILDIDAAAGGPEAIRIAREMSTVPILALSVRADEDATIEALEKGADDYVRKPFGVKELLARVKNVLRRRTREQGKPALLVTGDLEIDLLYRRVRLRGQEVHLPVKLYEVLRVLAEGVGRVRTREEILRAVWGARRAERIEYLRSAIRELRRKLEADPAHPRYIVTEMGVGYRLELLS
jgi:two-component system, OmpR family, KDP operon response regulator KdpE